MWGGDLNYAMDEVSLAQGLQAQQVWWEYNDQPFKKLLTRSAASRGLRPLVK